MPRRDPELHEYLVAAGRKVKMASYHLECLRGTMGAFRTPGDVPIPLQAHFEGVLFCADAAADQVLTFMVRRCHQALVRLPERDRTLTNVLSVLGGAQDCPIDRAIIAALEAWNAESIVSDARRVRNLAAHEYHLKSPRLEVETVQGSQYRGSRVVDAYCEQVVAHWKRLPMLLDHLGA
jgi:hypothetical protein